MQFLGGGRSFIVKAQDNRLRVWDVVSCTEKSLLVEKNHLSNKYSCIVCGSTKPNSSLGNTFVAAGTEDGRIIVWNLNRGVVSNTFKADTRAIGDMCFTSDCKSLLYVTSAGDSVVRQELTAGGAGNEYKRETLSLDMTTFGGSVSRICTNPRVDSALCGAGSKVGLVDLKRGRTRAFEAMVAGTAACVTFSKCGFFIACAGSAKREILVFSSPSASKHSPIAALACKGDIATLHVRANATRTHVDVLAVLTEGGVCVFKVVLDDKMDEVSQTCCEVKSTDAEPVLDAVFSTATSSMIVTARFDRDRRTPVFDDVQFVGEDGTVRPVVTLEPFTSGGADTAHASGVELNAAAAAAGVRTLGPFEMGAVKRPLVEAGGDAALTQLTKRKARADSDASIAEGPTMEEKLQKLSANLAVMENETGYAIQASTLEDGAPTSDSLATLLTQALQSGDEGMLEQALSCADPDVIEATARSLDPSKVVGLITKLTTKFEKRPARGLLITDWLDALIRCHASYLISVPELASQLACVSQIIEQRLSYYSQLARLQGRLDLLMSQFKGKGGGERVNLQPMKTVVNMHG